MTLRALSNPSIIKAFRDGVELPPRFGIGLDERIIEYNWLFSRLPSAPGLLLDAGATLNHEWVLSLPLLAKYKKVILTLAPEHHLQKDPLISYLFGDLRDCLLKDEVANVITCLSTLEHIGMDNSLLYTNDSAFCERQESDYLLVVQQVLRLLVPGGIAYFSVPFGQIQNHGWFQQFNGSMIDELISCCTGSKVSERYYKYDGDGWHLSNRLACRDSVYFDVHRNGRNRTADGAAAARAVACIEVVKAP